MNKTVERDNARAVEEDRIAQKCGVDADSDPQVLAWHAVAVHPFFADCYKTEGTFLDAVLAKLDAAHAHTCKPVWRPVTFEEIQPGWEVRTRRRDGSEVTWGTAHHRGDDDDWCTEAGALLTYGAMGWTYETTAPAEPNQLERGERDRRPTSAEASPPESGLTPEALAELRRDAESWLMIGGERVLPLLDALDRAACPTLRILDGGVES